MSTLEYRLFYRRQLPHLQPPGATLFVTFRLVGSIPAEALQRLRAEAERIEDVLAEISDPEERARREDVERRRLFGQRDVALHVGKSGPFWLRDPRIAGLVAESLHYRDGKVYDLEAFCVMPNHVHMVYTPLPEAEGIYHAMSAIMHSIKLYTACRANRLLGRRGSFWQHENYDHVVRDEAELQRIVMYVLDNPVKAGLIQQWEAWPWSYCR